MRLLRRLLWRIIAPGEKCGWWVGPIWKEGGETCVCVLAVGHEGWHECDCGAQFQGCGHPPNVRSRS